MNKITKHILEHLILGTIMGILYVFLEIIHHGYSHWSMFLTAFVLSQIVGSLNSCYSWNLAVSSQCLISTVVITTGEFIVGILLRNFGIIVWDYSLLPYSFMGVICILYTNIWFLLSLPTILLDDFLRWKLFKEPIQKYKWL